MLPTSPLKKPFSKLRLLIVDDDSLLADFLREALGSEFSLVMVASGILEAKTLFKGPFSFQAVVCDFQMKDGTGMDLYRWLRETRNSDVHFLMISGMVNAITQEEPRFAFLPKPFSPDSLMKQLELFKL